MTDISAGIICYRASWNGAVQAHLSWPLGLLSRLLLLNVAAPIAKSKAQFNFKKPKYTKYHGLLNTWGQGILRFTVEYGQIPSKYSSIPKPKIRSQADSPPDVADRNSSPAAPLQHHPPGGEHWGKKNQGYSESGVQNDAFKRNVVKKECYKSQKMSEN